MKNKLIVTSFPVNLLNQLKLWWLFGLLAMGMASLLVSAGSSAEVRFSMTLENSSLQEALEILETKTQVDLVYANELLEGILVSSSWQDTSLEQVLTQLLHFTGLSYRWMATDRIVIMPQPESELVTLRGYVASSVGPLSGVMLAIDGGVRITTTDDNGRFHLPRLPKKPIKLNIKAAGFLNTTLGYDPQKHASNITLVLVPKPLLAEQITVSNSVSGRQRGSLVIHGDWLRPEDIAAKGSISRDLFQDLTAVPGVSAGFEEGGVSFRGARSSENLVLLEGIKLYQLDHALGHFSALNPDAVGLVTLYKSGFPASYGDRVAGVLDISLKGEQMGTREVRAGLDRDLIHATLVLPLADKAMILFSARQSHSDATSRSVSDRLFASTFNDDFQIFAENDFESERRFRFEDQILRLNWRPDLDTRFSVTGFRSRDRSDEAVLLTDEQTTRSLLQKDAKWGNDGASIQFERQWNRGQKTRLLIAGSRFKSSFKIQEASEAGPEDDEAFYEDNFDRRNQLRETQMQLIHSIGANPGHYLEIGIFSSEIELRESEIGASSDFEKLAEDVGEEGEGEPSEYFDNVVTRQTGGFLNYHGSGFSRLRWVLGLRAGRNSATRSDFLEPRVSFRFDVDDHWQINSFFGQFHQYVLRSPDTINYFEGQAAWFLALEDEIIPGFSEQYQIGTRYKQGTFTLALDLYRKKQKGSLLKTFDPLRPDDFLVQTRETYRGLDLGLEKHLAHWSMSLGYSYQRTRVTENLTEKSPLDFPTSRDRPHNINTALTWVSESWEVACNWRYASGTPFDIPEIIEGVQAGETNIDLAQPDDRYEFRLPSRNQLDLRLSYGFPFLKGQVQMGISVTNMLDHRNITHRFYFFDEEEEDLQPVDILDFGKRVSVDLQVRF